MKQKFLFLLLVAFFALALAQHAAAQQLITDGDFNLSGAGWTTACVSIEAYAYETTYGGTDPTNHVAEIDDEACIYQDVCVLPGSSYVFSMGASRRTAGSAPSTVTSHINIVGLDASSAIVATYVDMDFSMSNTVFGFVSVAGIPVITVPCGSGVVYLKVTLTDNTPGYSTFGMIVDNISLTFVTPPSIIGPGTLCQGLPGTFSVSGGCSTGMTYDWAFTSGSPATSVAAAPSVSWGAAGTYPVSVGLGNGTCTVLTPTSSAVVLARVTATIHDTGCNGVPVVFRGTTYTTAGSYTVTVTNPGGCDSVITLIVYIRPPITGKINAAICDGQSYTTNGTTYTAAGDYLAGTFVSYTGCDSVVTLHLTVNPIPSAPIASASPSVYCEGQTFVPFTVSSGTNVLWYTSAASGTGSATAPVLNTAVPGPDTAWVSQTVNGCESPRVPVAITVLNKVVSSFTYSLKYGCLADTVAFTNTSSYANAFSWQFGDGNSSESVDPAHVYLLQGTDIVTLYVNGGGCIDSSNQTIVHSHPLHASFTADSQIVCQGSTIIFTDASTATTPSYLWNFGDGTAPVATTNPKHQYLHTGTYKVYEVVTDIIPCSDTAYQTLYIDSISPVHITITDGALCRSTSVTLTADYTPIGNTGIVWSLGNGDSVKGVSPLVYSYDTSGTFMITASALYRVCPEVSATHLVTIIPQPSIYLGPDKSICKGSDALFINDQVNAGNPNAKWMWSTGETTEGIIVTAPGDYAAAVTVKGCSASASVNVSNDCYINIPNVFTPNGDGLNDYFDPRQYLSRGLTSFSMDIYNRWGTMLFQTTSVTGCGWDGKYNGNEQPEGVYVYRIEATFKDGQKEHHQGNVTLMR